MLLTCSFKHGSGATYTCLQELWDAGEGVFFSRSYLFEAEKDTNFFKKTLFVRKFFVIM